MRKKDKIGIIEKLGQKIPDPVIIFILLYILVLVVTGIFGGNTFSMTSADGTSVSYEIKNMFTAENIRWIFSNAILDNWLGYAGGIVGTILIVMFGIGIAEESGLLSALIRRMGTNISDKLLPFVLVFLGIMSNIATDAGYLILIPLAGLLYVGIGKNPLIGMAAAFAGVSAGKQSEYTVRFVSRKSDKSCDNALLFYACVNCNACNNRRICYNKVCKT